MTPRGRFLVATLCGLTLAGLTHVAVVLAIPRLVESDILARARASDAVEHAIPVALGPARSWLPIPDPALSLGLCAYDLAQGPMRVSARPGGLMLSLSVHGRRGAFYAVTDQAAVRGALDLVILTRAQYDEALANEDENDVSRDVRIVATETTGFVVARVLAALPSQKPAADAALEGVSCVIDAAAEDAGPEPGADAGGKPR